MIEDAEEALKALQDVFVGKEVYSVQFIRSYIIVHFDGYIQMQLFVEPRISLDNIEWVDLKDRTQAFLLLTVIDKEITEITFDGEDFVLRFSNNLIIRLKRWGHVHSNRFHETGLVIEDDGSVFEF